MQQLEDLIVQGDSLGAGVLRRYLSDASKKGLCFFHGCASGRINLSRRTGYNAILHRHRFDTASRS